MPFDCSSLEEARKYIDRIDRDLVALIARRGVYVAQAARFKKDAADVQAPQRVEQVIAKVCDLARELGADPAVVEATWRAMVAAFIQSELQTHAALSAAPPAH